MLALDALTDYARENGMPENKTRGIIREYLQTLILKSLYTGKYSKNFHFLSGTALRFAYGLKRFSEDLDFNVKGMGEAEFKDAVEHVRKGLAKEGFACETEHMKRKDLLTAELTFPAASGEYGLRDGRGTLMIKIEARKTTWDYETETGIVNKFGELYPLNLASRGYMLSEKTVALTTHRRGRHVFDIIFMLSKKFPLDKKVFEAYGIPDEPKPFLKKTIRDIPQQSWKKWRIHSNPSSSMKAKQSVWKKQNSTCTNY
ncbi:MAG: nucleotidyl transferase AbiEii/AbiGii toxin family protein [Methanobacteriota archaeon]